MSSRFFPLEAARALLRRAPWRTCIDSSAVALSFAVAGCGSEAAAPLRQLNPQFEGPSFYEGALDDVATPAAAPSGLPGGDLVDSQTGAVPIVSDDPCVEAMVPAELVKLPVDIILLLDNSGSMADELEAVEANINLNFASILANSAVDYRVILISRHRHDPRDEDEEASTSICVSSPLSGLLDCTAADEPALTDQFFQYSTKIESKDSFDVMIDAYAAPFDDSERKDKFELAPEGWSKWLRPEAKKVFLEMTDDDEDMSVQSFLEQLMATGPHFGKNPLEPAFVFHSIVGLAEKPDPIAAYLPHEEVQGEICTGNSNVVQNAGATYQELSRLTGGLRFPLCQFSAYDVVFQEIAEDVVFRRTACDLAIPVAPPRLELDLRNVALQYDSGPGDTSARFRQAPTRETCEPEAFYIDGDRLNFCPETCDAIRADPGAQVTVLFMCESQLIVPR